MNAVRYAFVLCGLLAIAMSAAAQLTITSGTIPGPGLTVANVTAENVNLNVGSAGANQTWTIPALNWGSLNYSTIVSPAETPYANNFPTATRAIRSADSDDPNSIVFVFERIAASGYYQVGMAIQSPGANMAVPFSPEALAAPLPLTMGMSWTTVARLIIEPVPGYQLTSIDSSLRTIDGWGTLNTPFGSVQVLRGFTHQFEIEIDPLGNRTQSEDASYLWLDARCLPVAEYESNEETGNPNFTNGDVSLTGWNVVSAEPVRGPVADRFAVGQNYPNPFNPVTTLPVELAKSARVELDVYDATGRLVSSESFELSAGSQQLPVNGHAWGTGTYFARVTAGEQSQTVKMQLLK